VPADSGLFDLERIPAPTLRFWVSAARGQLNVGMAAVGAGGRGQGCARAFETARAFAETVGLVVLSNVFPGLTSCECKFGHW
jgi:hypothetical protein